MKIILDKSIFTKTKMSTNHGMWTLEDLSFLFCQALFMKI